MGRLQWAIVAVLVAVTALNGFNVQSISFASPSIAHGWGIAKAALGVVLSTELAGMAIGAFLLGRVADRLGRRPVLLGALALMAVGMAVSGVAGSIAVLTIGRLATGVGVGGMLAVGNSLVAEFSHADRRALSSALMMGGFPLGAVLGGLVATSMLSHGADWHRIFVLGAVVNLLMVPLAAWIVPESPSWLAGLGDMSRVNKVLRRLGHAAVSGVSAPVDSPKACVGRALAISTALLTAMFFLHSVTFYFFVKWLPTFVVGLGFPVGVGSSVLVWCNVGGVLGAVTLSVLTLRLRPIWLVMGMMAMSGVSVAMLGVVAQQRPSELGIAALAFAVGFLLNAGVVGSYGLMAATFPAAVRASGTGLVIGIGRIGSVLGPIIAGGLLQAGLSLGITALVMALGSVLGAVFAVLLSRRP